MLGIASSWGLEVDRGPDWLFVRLHPPEHDPCEASPLAEQLWGLLQQSFTYRVVLEMDRVAYLHSHLIGQLVLLSKRVHLRDGVLRLCGLSNRNQEILQACRLDGALPNFTDRGAAVMGHRVARPR